MRIWLPLPCWQARRMRPSGTWRWRSRPPEVVFRPRHAKLSRASYPPTAKVEPVEWAEARAGRAGAVTRILIQRGQRVDQDAVLVELDSAEARTELEAACACIAQVRADLDAWVKVAARRNSPKSRARWPAHARSFNPRKRTNDELSRLQTKDAATCYQVAGKPNSASIRPI